LRSGFQAVSSTRSSLWLGPDHLLCIESNGYSENYKRFYFRDIQAISLHRSRAHSVLNLILIPLTLLFAALGLAVGDEAARIVFLCMAGLPLIAFGVNVVQGRNCVCRIRTAVQEEEIPALARIRHAMNVLQRIRPQIEAAQGSLRREELPARLRELAEQRQPRLVVDDPNLPPRMTE